MATVEEHYENLLSGVYSWMFGGFDDGIEKNVKFFSDLTIQPLRSGLAVDLGAGCGFQSIPLALAGFSVTAIDIDRTLLAELTTNAGTLDINVVQDDLNNFAQHVAGKAELIVCMTDTLLHLNSTAEVDRLFGKVYEALEDGGRFIVTFRDLSRELCGPDRFIPVRNDDKTILTCFLEYEAETVKVHDILYRNIDDHWQLNVSYYRKLRLSEDWIGSRLENAGFSEVESGCHNGLVTIVAQY